jgi:hypothetical protein
MIGFFVMNVSIMLVKIGLQNVRLARHICLESKIGVLYSELENQKPTGFGNKGKQI